MVGVVYLSVCTSDWRNGSMCLLWQNLKIFEKKLLFFVFNTKTIIIKLTQLQSGKKYIFRVFFLSPALDQPGLFVWKTNNYIYLKVFGMEENFFFLIFYQKTDHVNLIWIYFCLLIVRFRYNFYFYF